MAERNITRYLIEQSDNNSYILTTCLINDKLKLTCQDSNSQTFLGAFTLIDLFNLSKYFKTTKSVDEVQKHLNGIVEKQRAEIYQDNVCIKIILHLINNDNITIPLTKKLIKNENNNYYNIPNITNQISNQYTHPNQPPNDMDNINYSYTVNYTNPQIDKDNANNNQLQTQINEIKMNYESKIAKLQNKLNKEKNNNKGLIDENNILKEKINNLNVKIEKLKGQNRIATK